MGLFGGLFRVYTKLVVTLVCERYQMVCIIPKTTPIQQVSVEGPWNCHDTLRHGFRSIADELNKQHPLAHVIVLGFKYSIHIHRVKNH